MLCRTDNVPHSIPGDSPHSYFAMKKYLFVLLIHKNKKSAHPSIHPSFSSMHPHPSCWSDGRRRRLRRISRVLSGANDKEQEQKYLVNIAEKSASSSSVYSSSLSPSLARAHHCNKANVSDKKQQKSPTSSCSQISRREGCFPVHFVFFLVGLPAPSLVQIPPKHLLQPPPSIVASISRCLWTFAIIGSNSSSVSSIFAWIWARLSHFEPRSGQDG